VCCSVFDAHIPDTGISSTVVIFVAVSCGLFILASVGAMVYSCRKDRKTAKRKAESQRSAERLIQAADSKFANLLAEARRNEKQPAESGPEINYASLEFEGSSSTVIRGEESTVTYAALDGPRTAALASALHGSTPPRDGRNTRHDVEYATATDSADGPARNVTFKLPGSVQGEQSTEPAWLHGLLGAGKAEEILLVLGMGLPLDQRPGLFLVRQDPNGTPPGALVLSVLDEWNVEHFSVSLCPPLPTPIASSPPTPIASITPILIISVHIICSPLDR
jgi:hypothetical protein